MTTHKALIWRIVFLPNSRNFQLEKKCRNALLSFDKDLRPESLDTIERDYDDQGIRLAKAANIVFRGMLILEALFTGSFDLDCWRRSVLHCFPALVSMILRGSNIKVHKDMVMRHIAVVRLMCTKPICLLCWQRASPVLNCHLLLGDLKHENFSNIFQNVQFSKS